MTAFESGGAAVLAPSPLAIDALVLGRFHIASVTFQRARQLQNNAAPRIEPDGHKLHRLALMEVLAGAVSWSVKPAVPVAVVPE
jgi:DNA-directed RNA polymerase subunit K/omega